MKEDNSSTETNIELTGKVTKGGFGGMSKSAHQAVYLETDSGDKFKLVRVGGNPFNDPELTKLVGKRIKAKGLLSNYQFMAREVKEVKE